MLPFPSLPRPAVGRRALAGSPGYRHPPFDPLQAPLLGQLAGALSRELAQPLTALLNEADSADLMLRRGALGEARACVGQMRLLGERLAELLAQLGDHAWRPDGRLQPTDVRECLELVFSALGILGGRHANGVSVHLSGAPEGPAIVVAPPGRLEQVFANLLRNALEAAALQGSAGRVEVRVLRKEAGVEVSVSDNGLGLSPVALSHLFEPFFTTKHDGSHLGLGLVVSRLIVEHLGGDLRACNGGAGGAGGAVLTLWLPEARAEAGV